MKTLFKRLSALILSLLLLCTLYIPANAATPLQTCTFTWDPTQVNDSRQELLSTGKAARSTYFNSGVYLTTWEEIEAALLPQLRTFSPTASVSVAADTGYPLEDLAWDVFDAGCKHTGVPTEGDYLNHSRTGVNAKMSYYTFGSTNYVTFTYTIDWITSPSMEAEMEVAVKQLHSLSQLSENCQKIHTVSSALH